MPTRVIAVTMVREEEGISMKDWVWEGKTKKKRDEGWSRSKVGNGGGSGQSGLKAWRSHIERSRCPQSLDTRNHLSHAGAKLRASAF